MQSSCLHATVGRKKWIMVYWIIYYYVSALAKFMHKSISRTDNRHALCVWIVMKTIIFSIVFTYFLADESGRINGNQLWKWNKWLYLDILNSFQARLKAYFGLMFLFMGNVNIFFRGNETGKKRGKFSLDKWEHSN